MFTYNEVGSRVSAHWRPGSNTSNARTLVSSSFPVPGTLRPPLRKCFGSLPTESQWLSFFPLFPEAWTNWDSCLQSALCEPSSRFVTCLGNCLALVTDHTCWTQRAESCPWLGCKATFAVAACSPERKVTRELRAVLRPQTGYCGILSASRAGGTVGKGAGRSSLIAAADTGRKDCWCAWGKTEDQRSPINLQMGYSSQIYCYKGRLFALMIIYIIEINLLKLFECI